MPEILNYSSCPLNHLDYRPRTYRHVRFGLEIETSEYGESEHDDTVEAWRKIGRASDSYASGYCIAAEDGSISGEEPAELKTPPFTKRDHELFHASACRMDAAAVVADATSRQRRQAILNGEGRWFPSSRAWGNRSCGMHITVASMYASESTWAKLLVWLNNRAARTDGRHKVLFLRAPNDFCYADQWAKLNHYNLAKNGHCAVGAEKYSTIHVKGRDLVEFRGFRSSLNPLTILRNIEVVESLMLFMQWVPFHEVAHTGLRTYGRWLRWHGGFPYLNHWILHRAADSELKQGFNTITTRE
jgi:hypothetical protein